MIPNPLDFLRVFFSPEMTILVLQLMTILLAAVALILIFVTVKSFVMYFRINWTRPNHRGRR